MCVLDQLMQPALWGRKGPLRFVGLHLGGRASRLVGTVPVPVPVAVAVASSLALLSAATCHVCSYQLGSSFPYLI